MEPPETPAPVFALRAFKSALFGTPGEEEEKEEENQGQAVKLKSIPAINPIGKTDALKQTTGSAEDAEPTKKDVDLDTQVMVSPTKGILVTPGTISNRRKTVSFGQEVVDNERKRDASPSKTPRTPTQKPGNVSSQWLSASSDGKNKPRSKLTQTLMDAREKTPPTSQPTRTGQKELAEAQTKVCSDDHNDETLNLDEPRSQSGKYWKADMITLPPPIPDLGEEHTQSRTQRLQSRRAPAKPRLESNPILAAPRVRSAAVHHVGSSRPGKKANLASVQIDAMTAERIAAAQARLRRKELNRRLKDEGKENIKAYAD
ncbi:hypothetical protein ASPZODRAFT_1341114 [Penicilliopsis zonata CBS 506.65]|uniref:Spindle pole body-associated protein cut12 domain-containing protein n=1 Tax=Penicilliopsis zonata CBS 506.65 TaxID=1073090 RepID=A0A1L9SNW3_9EURO|nr:hypothetical protein ASPZODRAFT_1341114 [Penicilliopsis zonata CBS 506.65]OJJ48888.1 hypothetical protein ASPZODRAFT_1341114 [Penicilliopsis zonata CBS 506.65]